MYFNRVLEARPDLSVAWMYKGLLIARTVRPEELTLRAVMLCFEQAVTHAPDAERENITQLCSGQAVVFASLLWDGLKAHASQQRGPVDPMLASRLVHEIGDALSFAVRHNADEQQLQKVLAVIGEISSHQVRARLQPATIDALARLHASTAEHLRARDPHARIPSFAARPALSSRQVAIVMLICVIIATYMFVWRSWTR